MINNVTTTITNVVKSKYFWYVVVILIIVFIIWKYQARIKVFFSKDNGDYSLGIGDTETTKATNEEIELRKDYISNLALRIYEKIHGYASGIQTVAVLKEALQLNDSELKYLSKEYKKLSPDETLREAVDDEWLGFYNEDDKLLARLSKLNEP